MGIRSCLPSKVCCCLDLELGTRILLGAVIILRFVCMVLGCVYGPYLYLVLPLGGLYLAADCLLIYVIFKTLTTDVQQGSSIGGGRQDSSHYDNTESCDFSTQRVWLLIWLGLNVLAILGLCVAIGLFANLGIWAMTYKPVHISLFVLIIILTALLIYAQVVIATAYLILKDAWLQGLFGSDDNDYAGLTHGGKRIYA